MAADLFETYAVTAVAVILLGVLTFHEATKVALYPLVIGGVAIIASIIGTFAVRTKTDNVERALFQGLLVSGVIAAAAFAPITYWLMRGLTFSHVGSTVNPPSWGKFYLCSLIGIAVTALLFGLTEYYTSTRFSPVKKTAKASVTGHATNIIQGFAVGYESAVVATVVIAIAILLSVVIYAGAGPIFVAYGVAMCGIGMLTLTGNTISMDVFGPVADNSNGIGEMGYDREEMGEENYKRARQILADLDAVGNTTKAETKGIAIGSAVIAAVSLFASFIAVLTVKSEDKIGDMTVLEYKTQAANLSIAYPEVFIGALIGGMVPFLFSSMLIRAVGRAAFLIVKECRMQFRDKEIWAGTKKPDYGRVVNICTSAAQGELIGPALLAILSPILVGSILGAQALGGYLAGMIVVGQLLAVFMANAGGAWDNAKKLIEDGVYGGKGSEAHKAAVTGDTVGDPLKDTAGPALNPLIKVMNMVSLLAIVPIIDAEARGYWAVLYGIGILCVVGIVWAVWRSKTESKVLREMEAELSGSAEASQSLEAVGS
jgi:K(+)-stimulated pyrophosphate-energized sodium pump